MRVSKGYGVSLVREAISLGINFIDTAHGYEDSEEKIGEAIRGMSRESLVIASKSPANDKKTLLEHLELSLRRLGTDYIDLYQLHNVGSRERYNAVLAPGGALEGLEEAVKSGKVRFPAFSSHSIPIALEVMKLDKFDAVQLPFNLIDSQAEGEAIPLAKKMDMGFIAMKTMGGGLLDNAELAFRYLFQFDTIIPDPGVERIEEIREIAAITEKNPALTEEDRREIERLRTEFGTSWCHRCDYCQPCSQGISISTILNVKSSHKRFSLEKVRAIVNAAVEKGKACLACGDCLQRCPYHLEIPQLIKENIAYWDNVTVR
jgi:predicted aldo/keto reductase-like oxidoreductase